MIDQNPAHQLRCNTADGDGKTLYCALSREKN
jgi:hypothetical protein